MKIIHLLCSYNHMFHRLTERGEAGALTEHRRRRRNSTTTVSQTHLHRVFNLFWKILFASSAGVGRGVRKLKPI